MYLLSTDDGLGTARLFDRKLWDRIETELGSAVAISVPTRDWVLVVRRSDEPAADKLRMMARRIVENEPYNISPTLLFRSTDGWVPLID